MVRITVRRAFAATATTLLLVSVAHADPVPRSNPDTCPTAFDCGALSARLAGADHDYPPALRASARACKMDAQFCEAHASLLIDAGRAHGGDPQRGLAMLEEGCRKNEPSYCSRLARVYDDPRPESGFSRRASDAERVLSAECDHGDSISCGMLANFYEKGCAFHTKHCPPGGTTDKAKALYALEKACRTPDQYAAGYCADLGDKLSRGTLGPTDRPRARTLLEDACTKGYWCNRAIALALEDNDLASAERVASSSCERQRMDLYCDEITRLEPKDPTWARATYTHLCAQPGNGRTKQWACAQEARLGSAAGSQAHPVRQSVPDRSPF
jgi:hypothetical protein